MSSFKKNNFLYFGSAFMEHHDEKHTHLLSVVIDNYISKGEPIGSKYLHSLDKIDYAPSTLRKYLNLLEKS